MLPLRELLMNCHDPEFKIHTVINFEGDEEFTKNLADVALSLKLKNPMSSAKDWLKEKLIQQQHMLNVAEKKSMFVTIVNGMNIYNPNTSSNTKVSPFLWFKFYNFNERWTESRDTDSPQWNENYTFDIYMNTDMMRYLETQSLMLYVMDNNAPETQN